MFLNKDPHAFKLVSLSEQQLQILCNKLWGVTYKVLISSAISFVVAFL